MTDPLYSHEIEKLNRNLPPAPTDTQRRTQAAFLAVIGQEEDATPDMSAYSDWLREQDWVREADWWSLAARKITALRLQRAALKEKRLHTHDRTCELWFRWRDEAEHYRKDADKLEMEMEALECIDLTEDEMDQVWKTGRPWIPFCNGSKHV